MTLLSERLLAALPAWRKLSGPNQLTSWQQFVSDVQEHINPLASQEHLRTLAQQLHSMGEVSETAAWRPAQYDGRHLCPNVLKERDKNVSAPAC